MDILDRGGPGQAEQVVVTGEILIPVSESLSAETGLVQTERLDHRAHCPVEHEHPFPEQAGQALADARSRRHALTGTSDRGAVAGLSPREWQIA